MINTIIHDDCVNVIPTLKKKYKNIFFVTDPPYNIGFQHYKDYKDNLPDEDYVEMISLLNGFPSCVIHYPEEMIRYVVPALGVPDEVLAWCYSSNLPKQFRLVNVYGRKPDFSKVLRPYKNPKDTRIRKNVEEGSFGTPMYDWFSDIQIVKNVSKEKTDHPCPIPVNLIVRLIKILATEDDIIVDPFLGSGTTAIACIKEKINYIGIEKDEVYFKLAHKKIEKCKEGCLNIFEN